MIKFIKFLVFVVIVLAVVGYFRGWYTVSKGEGDSVNVSFDRDKISDDTDKAKDAAGKIADKVKDAIGKKKEGTFERLDLITGKLVIKTDDGEEVEFEALEGLKALSDSGDLSMDLLKPGKKIRVHYDTKDGKNVITKVESSE